MKKRLTSQHSCEVDQYSHEFNDNNLKDPALRCGATDRKTGGRRMKIVISDPFSAELPKQLEEFGEVSDKPEDVLRGLLEPIAK